MTQLTEYKLVERRNKLGKLIALRGQHDQTMRCNAIDIVYGGDRGDGWTPTRRFLETEINRLKQWVNTEEVDR